MGYRWVSDNTATTAFRPCRLLFAAIISLGLTFGAVASQIPAPAPAPAPAADPLPFTNQFQGEYFTTDFTEVFRLRHIEGEGQGGVDAYTNFGFTKFVWSDNGVLLLDVGGRVTNDAEPGVTGGVHRRVMLGDFVVGAGLFYDWQDYSQGSVALELFSPNWAFRTNGYAILGEDVDADSEFVTTGATNIFFQGNNIVADGLALHEEIEVAMSGADIELARFVGFRATELFVGGYFYDGEIGDDTVGAKGGIRGFLVPDLAATLAVSSDDLFGTNLYGGLTWFVGAKGGLSRPNVARRLLIPVERNEQIVVNEIEETPPLSGPIALTGDDDEIIVVHVQQGAAGLNEGTFEDPFNALPATQEADIVYVHADGVFVGQSYTLAAEQRLLGEGDGNLHFVETDELGEILLPAGSGGANRPIIQAAPGNAITLAADENEVSNFEIIGAAGNGIFGNGITDFDINRNIITGSGGRGIFMNNISGAADGEPIASGEITDNVVTGSALQNIQLVLASDFEGDIEGNTADGSTTSRGIEITSLFRFVGDVEGNTANNNFLDGILVDVEDFIGDIEGNTANDNQGDGMLLAFGTFDGDVSGNTTSRNGDNGIDLTIGGDFFSDVDIENNTADDNTLEGMVLTFAGTGTSLVEVLNNNFSGNNGGVGREFLAQNEDVFGNRPAVFIELDGNTSANALGAGPPFNYEFENEDLFSDGEMTVDLGINVGTIGIGEGVELGDIP